MSLTVIPYYKDNYSFLFTSDNEALLFDCGDDPQFYERIENLSIPVTLFLTHKDHDHIDGVPILKKRIKNITIVTPEQALSGDFNVESEIVPMATPGHTIDHVSYYLPDISSLITGDALFAGGVGRCKSKEYSLFCNSLFEISKLPNKTKLYVAHEYLADNIRFIKHLEKNTEFYEQRMRSQYPSLAMTIEEELKHNPFFQICSKNNCKQFKELRIIKDCFKG